MRLATTVNAPFTMRSTPPFASVAVASDVFLAGSNGTNVISFGKSDAGLFLEAERIAASTESSESSLRVKVPVLSEHKTSIVAASSTADSRVGRTPSFARDRAPSAAARVNVAGNATGMAARTEVSKSGMISLHGIA